MMEGERRRHVTSPGTTQSTKLLLAAIACFWTSLYLYVPILGPYAEHIGAPMGMVGLIVSSYGFAQLVLRIPTGLWSDRIGKRKPFIMVAFVAAAGAGLGMALSGGVWGLLGARTLSGVSATMWVVLTVLFSSYYPHDRAGYAMSLVSFATIITQLGATLAGGLIAEKWGWQAPFWLAMVVGLLGIALTLRIKEVNTRPLGLTIRQLAAVGREPSLLLVSGLGALYQFNMFVTVYGFTPNYAVHLGASKAELGWLGVVSILPMAVASLGSGTFFAKRFSDVKMVTAGLVMACVGTAVIPLCTTLASLYATQAVAGFGRGLVFAVLMGMSIRTVPQEKRATAMGFFQSIYALGMFGGPAISGLVAQGYGLGGAFYCAAVVTGIGAVISAGWLARTFQKATPKAESVAAS